MLGFIGNSFLGERLFHVVKKQDSNTIELTDYLIYNDVIYYGEAHEKFINSFKMMDMEGKGRITQPFFINFWQQFIKMYGQMLHTKLKFTDLMEEYFNQAFKLVAKDKDFFNFDDYKSIKEEESDFLSIIEDIGDLSLENTQINEEKESDAISRDEFTEYHSKVLEMFKETQDELKREFEIEPNPLLARIGDALVQKHSDVTSDFMRRQFLMGL